MEILACQSAGLLNYFFAVIYGVLELFIFFAVIDSGIIWWAIVNDRLPDEAIARLSKNEYKSGVSVITKCKTVIIWGMFILLTTFMIPSWYFFFIMENHL